MQKSYNSSSSAANLQPIFPIDDEPVNDVHEFQQSFSSSSANNLQLTFPINDEPVYDVHEFNQSFSSSLPDNLQLTFPINDAPVKDVYEWNQSFSSSLADYPQLQIPNHDDHEDNAIAIERESVTSITQIGKGIDVSFNISFIIFRIRLNFQQNIFNF